MKKILVIDDQDYILESTALLLQFEGYQVVTATNGVEGVSMAQDILPDLILCDISMPEMDGYGVLEAVRKNRETATIPFVFLTARAEKRDMREGMSKGADDFLIKPYTRDELISAVNAQWQKHQRLETRVGEKIEEVRKNVTYALPHEFRIVLNEVMGSAAYLKNIAHIVPPEGIVEFTDDILKSAQRLLRITQNFLAYVETEMLAADPQMRKVVRKSRVDEPGATVADLSAAKANQFQRNSDLTLGANVEGISLEVSTETFFKIVDELVDNAFRFSKEGSKVLIDCWLEGANFNLRIQDHGRGMSADQLRKIGAFKQFDRLIYEQQGVGLGLIVAKKMVELHDGSFTIDSREGSGTTVLLTLPVAIETLSVA